MNREERAAAMKAHLEAMLADQGWKKEKDDPVIFTKLLDKTYRGVTRPFINRVMIVGSKVKYQVQINDTWIPRSICLLEAVVVGKGYTQIGSEFIYH